MVFIVGIDIRKWLKRYCLLDSETKESMYMTPEELINSCKGKEDGGANYIIHKDKQYPYIELLGEGKSITEDGMLANKRIYTLIRRESYIQYLSDERGHIRKAGTNEYYELLKSRLISNVRYIAWAENTEYIYGSIEEAEINGYAEKISGVISKNALIGKRLDIDRHGNIDMIETDGNILDIPDIVSGIGNNFLGNMSSYTGKIEIHGGRNIIVNKSVNGKAAPLIRISSIDSLSDSFSIYMAEKNAPMMNTLLSNTEFVMHSTGSSTALMEAALLLIKGGIYSIRLEGMTNEEAADRLIQHMNEIKQRCFTYGEYTENGSNGESLGRSEMEHAEKAMNRLCRMAGFGEKCAKVKTYTKRHILKLSVYGADTRPFMIQLDKIRIGVSNGSVPEVVSSECEHLFTGAGRHEYSRVAMEAETISAEIRQHELEAHGEIRFKYAVGDSSNTVIMYAVKDRSSSEYMFLVKSIIHIIQEKESECEYISLEKFKDKEYGLMTVLEAAESLGTIIKVNKGRMSEAADRIAEQLGLS